MYSPPPLLPPPLSIAQSPDALSSPRAPAIHFIGSVEQGHAELPCLFKGQPLPTEAHKNDGTGNYARPPAMVVAGPGFTDEEFRRMHDGCAECSRVPWLQPDASELQLAWADPAFPGHLAQRVKECVRDVVLAGRMGTDGVYSYKL